MLHLMTKLLNNSINIVTTILVESRMCQMDSLQSDNSCFKRCLVYDIELYLVVTLGFLTSGVLTYAFDVINLKFTCTKIGLTFWGSTFCWV